MSDLYKMLKEEGITCTPVGMSVAGKNVTLEFRSSDVTQFTPFMANQDEPIILLAIPAQGELAFTETDDSDDGGDGTKIDVELPLEDEVKYLCPECDAPLAECTAVQDGVGNYSWVCGRIGCAKQGVAVFECDLEPAATADGTGPVDPEPGEIEVDADGVSEADESGDTKPETGDDVGETGEKEGEPENETPDKTE